MRLRVRLFLILIAFTFVDSGRAQDAGKAGAAGETATDAALRSYHAANGLLQRGLHDLAAAEYRTFLAQHGEHARAGEARYGLAVCLARLNKPDEAIAELRRLPNGKEFAFAVEGRTLLGQLLLGQKKYAEAAEVLSAVARDHAEHALADDAAALGVEAQYRAGEFDAAAREAREFEKRWPENGGAERVLYFGGLALAEQKRWQNSAEMLAALRSRFPKSRLAAHAGLVSAQCREQAGALDAAAEEYRAVAECSEADVAAEARYALGLLEQRRGRLDAAAEAFARCRGEKVDDARDRDAALRVGQIRLEQNRLADAESALRPVSDARGEGSDRAGWLLAKCLLRGEKSDEAARLLSETIERNPASAQLAEMRYDLAVALSRAGKDEEAAAAARVFVEKHGGHALAADALHLAAAADHHRGRYSECVAACDVFLKDYPAQALAAEMSFLAAESELLGGREAEAIARYRAFAERFGSDARAPRARLRLGMLLFKAGKLDEARGLLEGAAALAREDAALRAGLLALGDILLAREEWKPAAERFSEYLATGERAARDEALLKLGLARLRAGEAGPAIEAFDQLLKENAKGPLREQALFERGQALVAAGRDEDARQAFRQVVEEAGESRFAGHALVQLAALAMRAKEYEKAVELAGRVSKLGVCDEAVRADALLCRGEGLAVLTKYAEAEAALREFASRWPQHARAVHARARLATMLVQQEKAAEALGVIEDLERVGGLDAGEAANLRYEKAWCLGRAGRGEEAAAEYRLVADGGAGPQRAHALLALAEREAREGRCAGAIALLEKLLNDAGGAEVGDDVRAAAGYRLGVCLFDTKSDAAALEKLAGFLAQFPGHALAASARSFAGEAALRLNRTAVAAEHFERLVADFPKAEGRAAALLRLGECQTTLQQWAAAERTFERFLAEFARDEHACAAKFGLGFAREGQGRHDEAIRAYREALEGCAAVAPRAQFQIGECLFAQKKFEEAAAELLKVDILYSAPEWGAAALFEAGRCFEQLARPAEARKQYLAVVEKYKETKWAAGAKERMDALAKQGAPGRP